MITIITHCQSSTSVSPMPGVTIEATKLVAAPPEAGKASVNGDVLQKDGVANFDIQKAFPKVREFFQPGELYEVTFKKYTPKA